MDYWRLLSSMKAGVDHVTGNVDAIKEQFGKVDKTCNSCHDK
jgi:cytochrome c556